MLGPGMGVTADPIARDHVESPGARLKVAGVPEPSDRVPQTFGVGTRANAELSLRLGGAEEHHRFGETNSVHRRERLLPGDPGRPLGGVGDRQRRAQRETEQRARPADQFRYVPQHLRAEHVLAAENIALAHLPALERGYVPRGDILHVHQIEPRIDIGGDFAGSRRGDHPARGGGANVARSNGRRWVHDDGRQTLLRYHVPHQTLRRDLAAFIGPHALLLGKRAALVGGRAVRPQRQRGGAARIDHPLDSGAEGLLHEDARSDYVRVVDRLAIARPQPIVRRDVKHVATAVHRQPDRTRDHVYRRSTDRRRVRPDRGCDRRGGSAHEPGMRIGSACEPSRSR